MELEQSSLYREITSVINGTGVISRHTWNAEVHIPSGTSYPVIKVLSVDFVEDFENNFTGEIILSVVIPGGVYAKQIFPNQAHLDITLYKIPLLADSDLIDTSNALNAERFTATLLPDKGNPIIEGNSNNMASEDVLNLTELTTVNFQLMDKALEQMRVVSVGGTYRKTTGEKVIQSVLTNASANVKADGIRMPKGVTMVPASNQEERDHVIIPQGLTLTDLPNYVQERCGGVYSAGLGYHYKDSQWYVYPCYDTTRFNNTDRTMTVINVPKNKFPNIERTYKENGNNFTILATGSVSIKDFSEVDQLNKGNGVRFSNANNFMGGFATVKDNKAFVSRGKNNTEIVSKQRPNGNNFVRLGSSPITANPYAEYSRMAKGLGAILSFEWQNSNPSLVYPGMLIKLLYLDKDDIKQLEGVLLKAHHFVQLRGKGLLQTQYNTQSVLYVFTTRPRDF